MSNRTQGQQESEEVRAVFHPVNHDALFYLCGNTASCVNGNLCFVVEYSNDTHDENGEFQGLDVWGDVLEVTPGQIGELLAGPLADAVRSLLHSVAPYLAGETLEIYMADKARRSARASLNDILAGFELEVES